MSKNLCILSCILLLISGCKKYEVIGNYEEANSFSDGMALVKRDGKFGYINTKGEEIIETIFDYAQDFSDGLAYVEKSDENYYIDKGGKKTVSPVDYKISHGEQFKNGIASVRAQIDDIEQNVEGIINKNGDWVIKPEYFSIINYGDQGVVVASKNERGTFKKILYDIKGAIIPTTGYSNIGSVTDNLINVEKNGKWGFLNNKGIEIIPCIYDEPSFFNRGYAIVKKGGQYEVINKEGVSIYKNNENKIRDFNHDNLIIVSNNGKYGIVDRSSRVVIPLIYDDLEFCYDKYIKAQLNGKYGLIDIQQKVIIPFDYVYIGQLTASEDKLELFDIQTSDKKFGIFSIKDGMIVPPLYEDIGFRECGWILVEKEDSEGRHIYNYFDGINKFMFEEEQNSKSNMTETVLEPQKMDYDDVNKNENGIYAEYINSYGTKYILKTDNTIEDRGDGSWEIVDGYLVIYTGEGTSAVTIIDDYCYEGYYRDGKCWVEDWVGGEDGGLEEVGYTPEPSKGERYQSLKYY